MFGSGTTLGESVATKSSMEETESVTLSNASSTRLSASNPKFKFLNKAPENAVEVAIPAESSNNLAPCPASAAGRNGLELVLRAIKGLRQPMGSTTETIYRKICADHIDLNSNYVNMLMRTGIEKGLKKKILVSVTNNCYALNSAKWPTQTVKRMKARPKIRMQKCESKPLQSKGCAEMPTASSTSTSTVYGSHSGFPDKNITYEDSSIGCCKSKNINRRRKKTRKKRPLKRRCMSDSSTDEETAGYKAKRCAKRAYRRMPPTNPRIGTTASSEKCSVDQLPTNLKFQPCSSRRDQGQKKKRNKKRRRYAMEERRANRMRSHLACAQGKFRGMQKTSRGGCCKQDLDDAVSAATARYVKSIKGCGSTTADTLSVEEDDHEANYCLEKGIRHCRDFEEVLSSSGEENNREVRMRRTKSKPEDAYLGCKNRYKDKPKNLQRRMGKKIRRHNKNFFNLW